MASVALELPSCSWGWLAGRQYGMARPSSCDVTESGNTLWSEVWHVNAVLNDVKKKKESNYLTSWMKSAYSQSQVTSPASHHGQISSEAPLVNKKKKANIANDVDILGIFFADFSDLSKKAICTFGTKMRTNQRTFTFQGTTHDEVTLTHLFHMG